MAAASVGGAFLSAALQVAFDRLASRDVVDYFRGRKLKDGLLEKLNITLISVNQVLEDAEERQYKNPNVKQWLDKLKDIVYVADDLLDEIAFEATRQKLAAESQTATSKVRGFFTSLVNPFDKEIEVRIQQVLENLEYLAKQKSVLGLKEGSGDGNEIRVGGKVASRLPTTSLVDESRVYGRDGDKEEIIKFLLCDSKSGNRLSVISIVGMGGVGKTTLAQLVYNDGRMEDQFQLKTWVCISEEFDVVRITKTILAALDYSITGYEDLNLLQLKLKEKLIGKKFLLVLDDVWNEDCISWEALQVPFLCGDLGSKILVTTRNEKVALVMHSIRMHHLQQLEEEDGWKLFVKHAFNDKDAGMYRNLESIGREIVQKCKGLPLAIKSLGGLLHTKLSERHWCKILESDIWQLQDDESNIIPALRLSYYYLPSNMKRCFAFCSIFPKDYVINKDFLIQLWIAEDLLHCHQGYKSAHELGNDLFNDLESRSFFQSAPYDGHFIMHDLVNDLAKSVSREFCLRIEEGRVQDISTKARHISYSSTICDNDKILEPIYKCKSLRSFLLLHPHPFMIKSYMIPLDSLLQFKYLRSLTLHRCKNIDELAFGISNLKHLHYLDLSSTSIERLPNSICTLYNLQILKLHLCFSLVELPLDLYKLINLCYLDLAGSSISKLPNSICKLHNLHSLILEGCGSLVELPPNFHKLVNLCHLNLRRSKIREMPMQMAMLENLQILTDFFVGRKSGTNIMELGKLNHLRGTLTISELQNVNNPMEAKDSMKDKKFLHKLELVWSGNNEDSQNERSVLEALQPHINLKYLTIVNYGGTRFVDWCDAPYLPNLVYLQLKGCKYCFCFPPLGQLPSLKSLRICSCEGIKKIGPEIYGNNLSTASFRSLELLWIQDMEEWEEWIHIESECFPCLNELRLSDCPKLRTYLPPNLPCLKSLRIFGCHALESLLPEVVAKTNVGNSTSQVKEQILVTYPSLERLELHFCLKLVSFSTCAFSTPKLEIICLHGLSNMKSLPENMHTLLPSLKGLRISDCPQLELFHQGNFPLCLVGLSICRCPKLIDSRKEWGLHNLHSLQRFEISYDFEKTESFPEEALLPTTLTHLKFSECTNLKTINCKGLLHLKFLQSLHIVNCPSLGCLPEEGLPKSLSALHIWGDCPLLKERYQNNKGRDWHEISHIPLVEFMY